MYNQGRGIQSHRWAPQQPDPSPVGHPPNFGTNTQLLFLPSVPGYHQQTTHYNPRNASGSSFSHYLADRHQPSLVNPYAPSQFTTVPPNLQTNPNSYHSSMNHGPESLQLGTSRYHGGVQCSRQGCSFQGRSKHETEIHMMDRHFIYPPDYNTRKRKRDEGGGPDGDLAR